ncbi:MAG: HIT family protein [Candidatus Magasanikbacteria bacterium]|nr:HIT family protein [Candidatus Magasanikbacteria bacterium]
MSDCIFCKIIKGEVPNYIVYEDKSILAFLDIFPHAKGHTVVVPKRHIDTYFDLSDDEMNKLSAGIKKAMEKIQAVLKPDGFNVGWNQSPAGGQVVPHLHIHIMPRYEGDGGGSMHSIVNNPGDVKVGEVAKLF